MVPLRLLVKSGAEKAREQDRERTIFAPLSSFPDGVRLILALILLFSGRP